MTGIALPRLPARKPDAHKGDCGRVLVVAGSRGMTGAAALCASAAVRGGAGLVTCATPRECYPIVAAHLMEALFAPMPQTAAGTLAPAAARLLRERAAQCDVVALGPGLSTDPGTARCVAALLPRLGRPCVIDADGLTLLAQQPCLVCRTGAPVVITPHPGEMARLSGLTTAQVQADREGVARRFAKDFGCVVVLKGRGTVVTDGARVRVNRTGNPGMATGGSGDVLTGLIAALIGQGLSALDAAVLGAHLHGLAGDRAAKARGGTIGLAASDLLTFLPDALRSV
jgi:ADP-dependent NAD(P)H-hydrate dehydratase / NAD(P)H-hydrate epimerase